MQKVKLGSICKLRQGFQVPLPEQEVENKPGYVRFIRIVDYTQQTSDIRYVKDNEKYYYVEPDDVVMIRYGAAGEVGHGIRGIIANNMFLIEPQIDINKDYLFYYLAQKKIRERLLATSTSTTMPALNFKIVNELEIPLYDKDKQDYLVMIFELLSGIIKKRKDELQTLDELIKARFVELFGNPRINPFGYEKMMLKDTCKVITGNTPSRAVEDYYGNYVEWVKTDNIVSGILNPTKASEYLSEKGMGVGRTVDANAILMACIAGSIASIGRVCVTDRTVAFNQQINAVVPEKYNILFLYVLLLISKEYLVEDINMSLKGILSKSRLEEKEFIVPPMELQNEFAEFVKQVDKSKVVWQKTINIINYK